MRFWIVLPGPNLRSQEARQQMGRQTPPTERRSTRNPGLLSQRGARRKVVAEKSGFPACFHDCENESKRGFHGEENWISSVKWQKVERRSERHAQVAGNRQAAEIETAGCKRSRNVPAHR